ncbi:hypothetical protein TWF696_008301 [Orbilia brochopaga]|uniref:Pentatricopeptide repeat domain-containing protein n=1 Tax=Orbilia brochopaga TaxID=3140254 RepID=A0AAV9UGV0_9PEZI
MNFHQYGRSLKPAVSGYRYRHTARRHHPRVTNCHAPSRSTRQLHSDAAAASSDEPSENAKSSAKKFEHGYMSGWISKEDQKFAAVARLSNSKANIRQRIYSDHSILKPNPYDILSDISCFQRRDEMLQQHYEIPWQPAIRTDTPAQPRAKKQPRTSLETRSPARASTHKQLFSTIDGGFERGPSDWPATFYFVACGQGGEALTPAIRSASLAYMVKKFVLGGRHEDVLRVYTEIQNSWLTAEQRELDAMVYFESLLNAFTEKPAPSHSVVTQVLNNFELAYENFDRQFIVGRTHSFRERLTPALLIFLSTNLRLRESLTVIKAQATNLSDQKEGDRIIPEIYYNLNKSLLDSQKPLVDPIDRDNIHTFYIAQSKILHDLSSIPRTAAVNTPLARVFLDQAITWEEVLEAKRLMLDSPDRSDIITYQSAFMRALHRLSPAIAPGSIHGRSMSELVTDLRWLFNLKGCARQRGTFIGTAASIYARLGVFRALELLLDAVDAVKRPYSISATYIRETIQCLAVATQSRAAVRSDTKSRAVDIAMRMLQLHFVCVSRSPRERNTLHQGLVRDVIRLLAFCGAPGAIRDVWQSVLSMTPRGNLDRSTLETALDGLLAAGDVQHAMKILKTVPTATGGNVTASTLRPFLTAAVSPPDALTNDRIPLDEVVRIGIQKKVQWGSVAHVYYLRSRQDENDNINTRDARIRHVEVWARAIQACADEITHERQQPGAVFEKTLTRLEQVFKHVEADGEPVTADSDQVVVPNTD